MGRESLVSAPLLALLHLPPDEEAAALLREVYDVSGCVSGEGPQAYVDYA